MKRVVWMSTDGYKHCAVIPDNEPVYNYSMGIPCDPPDINQINWEAVKRELHNLLVERELIVMADVNRKPENLKSAANAVLYKRLVALYTNQNSLKEESNV